MLLNALGIVSCCCWQDNLTFSDDPALVWDHLLCVLKPLSLWSKVFDEFTLWFQNLAWVLKKTFLHPWDQFDQIVLVN